MRTVDLSIPKPCHEDWNSFTPSGNGRYCGSCEKVVVDFTSMTDTEIIDYFAAQNGRVCGRFSSRQLKSYAMPAPPAVSPGFRFFIGGLIALILLIVSRPSLAQVDGTKTKTEIIDKASSNDQPEKRTIRGTVIAKEDGMPLPGVNIIQKGTVYGTVTDEHGNFIFPEPLEAGDVLVFSFIGLVTVEYRITKEDEVTMHIPMVACDFDLTGEVAVAGMVYEGEPGMLTRWWRKIKNIF